MRKEDFFEVLGELDDDIVKGAKATMKRKNWKSWGTMAACFAIMAALLIGTAVAAVVLFGDVWRQNPSNDPVESVRAALENQVGKDYTLKIEVKSVEVDEPETERVVERFIKGVIAERRGWSDEYLAEHFLVVKAVYYAEYDHTQTTRSDGEVTMYFYLAQDVDSGQWTIVDNSGNVNRPEQEPTDELVDPTAQSAKEQIFSYLEGLFNRAYSPYYDGLHYEMSAYEETSDGSSVTATFLWTMYHLGKGWDVGSDEGVEQQMNCRLQATATVNENGFLDLETISVLMDTSVRGGPDYSTPIEELFPTQLAE